MVKTRGLIRNRNPSPVLAVNGKESGKKNHEAALNTPLNNARQSGKRQGQTGPYKEHNQKKNQIIDENLEEDEDQNQQIHQKRTKPINSIRQNLNRDATQNQNKNLDEDLEQDEDQDLN